MSNTVSSSTNQPSQNSFTPSYAGTAYGLIEEIEEDLEVYDLNPDQVSFDVDIEGIEDSLEIEYSVETLEWYESDEELGLGKDPVSFSSSYSVESEIPEDEINYVLEDNFDGAAIRANGEVLQESPSPDYDAF